MLWTQPLDREICSRSIFFQHLRVAKKENKLDPS